MSTPPSTGTTTAALARDWVAAARYYLGGRRAILLLASVAVVTGITFNWGWLVATGLAPILIALLPCAVMCWLGLCLNKSSGASCSSGHSHSTTAADGANPISAQPEGRPPVAPAAACCAGGTAEAAAPPPEKTPPDEERKSVHA